MHAFKLKHPVPDLQPIGSVSLLGATPTAGDPQVAGAMIYGELDQLRKLRNRIAHHEPIFSRNLGDDFEKMRELIALRCPITSAWMLHNQQATVLIGAKPP